MGNQFAASLWTAELIITGIAATTMLMLVSYSRQLKITWCRLPERIALGFVVSLSASAFAALAAGRLVIMLTAQRFSQIAYLAALGVWGWALCTKETLPEKASLEVAKLFWRELTGSQEEINVTH